MFVILISLLFSTEKFNPAPVSLPWCIQIYISGKLPQWIFSANDLNLINKVLDENYEKGTYEVKYRFVENGLSEAGMIIIENRTNVYDPYVTSITNFGGQNPQSATFFNDLINTLNLIKRKNLVIIQINTNEPFSSETAKKVENAIIYSFGVENYKLEYKIAPGDDKIVITYGTKSYTKMSNTTQDFVNFIYILAVILQFA